MSAPTQGPWRRGRTGDSIVAGDVPPMPSPNDYETLDTDEHCRRAYGGDLIAESIRASNLPLIEAAPEILTQLKSVTECLNMARIVMDQGSRDLAGGVVNDARAVIAKAEGR